MSFDGLSKNFPAKFVQFLVAGLLFLLVCLPAFSQVNLGRISGNVTDQSGGVVAGAKVTITDQERGTVRSVVTDAKLARMPRRV